MRQQARVAKVRVAAADHAALVVTAEAAGIPATRLARVLVAYGLAELVRGNQDLERAGKSSRDG